MRAGGVQSLPTEICTGTADESDRCLVIAINTWNKWSNASENGFQISIDTDRDEQEDYYVFGLDAGLVFGVLNGIFVSLIFDADFNFVDAFFATAPNNGATMLLPVLASNLGLTEGGDSDFDYIAYSFDVYDEDGTGTLFQFDLMTTKNNPALGSQWARFDAFDHPISNGNFVPLGPGESVEMPLRVEKDGYRPLRGMKGWMIVTMEDASGQTDRGQDQADLILVGDLPN